VLNSLYIISYLLMPGCPHCCKFTLFFVISRLLPRNRLAAMKARQVTQLVWPKFLGSTMLRLATIKDYQVMRHWFYCLWILDDALVMLIYWVWFCTLCWVGNVIKLRN